MLLPVYILKNMSSWKTTLRTFHWNKHSVPDKRISCVSIPAVADGPVTIPLAVGVDSAGWCQARVQHTVDERIAFIVWTTPDIVKITKAFMSETLIRSFFNFKILLADGATSAVLAVSVGSAWILSTGIVVAPNGMVLIRLNHLYLV